MQRIGEEQQSAHRRSRARLREVLTAVQAETLAEYDALNMVSVRIPTRAIALLLSMDEILAVEADTDRLVGGPTHHDPSHLVKPTAWNHDMTAALAHFNGAAFRAIPNRYHYPLDTDKGNMGLETVAVIDSGVQQAHPEIVQQVICKRWSS
jgi:hypothetical protein